MTAREAERGYRETNPKHLDCGDLFDAETGEYLGPASADQARRSIRARRPGDPRGVIETRYAGDPVHAYVVKPSGISVALWRLSVALKIKAERRAFGAWPRS